MKTLTRFKLLFCIVFVINTVAIAETPKDKSQTEVLTEILKRLEQAEQKITDLEDQNQKLKAAAESSVNNAAPSKTVLDASNQAPTVIAAPADQIQIAPAVAPVEAKKNWYDKLQVRGYTQFRYSEEIDKSSDSAPAQHVNDRSISKNQSILMRRARIIIEGDISDRAYFYFQPDFANVLQNSPDQTHYAQIRDLYADLYLDKEKIHRLRVGQSKVPYGFENLQSSSNRVPLERNDAFNSGTKNERDLGVFYYWTPTWVQSILKELKDKNLKGSGNYGMFGFGAYNGQGGSLSEQNNNMHLVSRFMVPHKFDNGQIMEAAIQGYQGRYSVLSSSIYPLGIGHEAIKPINTVEAGNSRGVLDERIGASFVLYPQPFGFQTEWTVGRGPTLSADQTMVDASSLNGGYAMAMYKIDDLCGTWIPYIRWSYFDGGYKSERNSPDSEISELELGTEWQLDATSELTFAYMKTDRTNTSALSSAGTASYGQYQGDLLRVQYQVNY